MTHLWNELLRSGVWHLIALIRMMILSPLEVFRERPACCSRESSVRLSLTILEKLDTTPSAF